MPQLDFSITLTGPLKIGELQQPAKLHKLTGAYAQSKLALNTLTNALAQEYQKEGIWLRSLDPGANKTPMTSGQGMPKLLLLLRQLAFQAPEKGAKAIYDTAFDQKFANQKSKMVRSRTASSFRAKVIPGDLTSGDTPASALQNRKRSF